MSYSNPQAIVSTEWLSKNINDPDMPERQKWANKLAYTEWWIDEIEKGLPWKRIKTRLEEKYLK